VRESDVLHFELRDDDGTFGGSELIGAVDIRGGIPSEARSGANWNVRLEGGAQLVLTTHPPLAKLGMGVIYEYRHEALVIVEVRQAGPAANAGLRVGDRVVRINGRAVGQMAEMEVRQAMDRSTMSEVTLSIERAGAAGEELVIRADALYLGR
jgi:predicted metalloprotease with PDZ domain